jgi:TRAP-type C4-dicarboxylate transport system permease small subunit
MTGLNPPAPGLNGHTALARASAVWRMLERLCAGIATLALLATMLLVTLDVFMRYALNRPFSFTYDLIGMYLLAVVFFFTLSDALREHEHVSVDILVQHFPPAGRRLSELVTSVTGLAVFCLVAWLGWTRMVDSYRAHDVVVGAILWPTWLSIAPVPLGSGIMAVRLALQLIGNLCSLLTGKDLYPLPPITAEHRGLE